MKKLLTFIIVFLSHAELGFTWSIAIDYNLELEKVIKVDCHANDTLCINLCSKQERCTIKEPSVKKTIGSSIRLTHFFENVGILYINTFEVIDETKFADFLELRQFLAIDAENILNLVYRYDDPIYKLRFQDLCTNSEKPIVFCSTNSLQQLHEIEFVTCGQEVYKMDYLEAGEWQLNIVQ